MGETRPALLVFLGAVGFLLLIACTNVGGLHLAQGFRRSGELGIRAALGASRSRLVGLLLLEGLATAVLAAGLSLLLTHSGLKLLLPLLPEELPRLGEIQMSAAIVLFAALLAVVCTLLFALVPAWLLSRQDLFRAIRGSGRSTESFRQRRMQNSFLTIQLAVSMILLFGGVLLFRSYLALRVTDPGFQPANLMALQVFPDMAPDRLLNFYQDVLDSFEQTPGVLGAAGVLSLPLSGEQSIELTPTFWIDGQPRPQRGQQPVASLSVATPNYFRVMGIPLLAGRTLEASDRAGAPMVGLISQSMARRFWPDRDPVGARVHLEYDNGLDFEVVGVVGDVRHETIRAPEGPRVYLPYGQGPSWSMTFVARTQGKAESYFPLLKERVWQAGYRRPIDRLSTMEWLLADSIRQERFRAWVLGLFSVLALGVVAVGLYSSTSSAVASRRAEIGIRLAIGATPRGIFGQVLVGSLKGLLWGGSLGIVGGFFLSQALSEFLYQSSRQDFSTLVGVLLVLGAVVLPTALLPARRASRVDPVLALKDNP